MKILVLVFGIIVNMKGVSKMKLIYYVVLTRTKDGQEFEKLIGSESKEVALKEFPKVYGLPVLGIKKCTKKDRGTFRGGVR